MKKRALITGITGQSGSYLAEILLKKGYEVHGLVRRCSTFNTQRIDHIRHKLILHYGDATDPFSIMWALKKSNPSEIYNLMAQSHVQVSWETPLATAQITGVGVLNLLESVRVLGMEKKVRIYQASTSELYSGRPEEAPQDENTRFDPVSPYGSAKLYGFQIAKNYREAFGMYIVNGVLFNHESPRRGDNFVTKKVVLGVNDILQGKIKHLELGNLEAKRDWGDAENYMEVAWQMLQQKKPADYIVATGETHSIKELCDTAFGLVGLDWKKYVRVNKDYVRPAEVDVLCGNPKKAMEVLNWKPKRKFKDIIKWMMDDELKKRNANIRKTTKQVRKVR